jgi:DNA-binding NarL/FixJ family response regulator
VAEFAQSLGASTGASRDAEELAPNELALLRRVASGLSNAEIAAETHTHEATVRADVARILATLRLRDRVHAVVFAHERGLLAVDECADTDVTS